jgi:hypothetical protein
MKNTLKITLFTFSLFLTPFAFAGFSGQWQGTGKIEQIIEGGKTQKINCQKVMFVLNRSVESFNMAAYLDCDGQTMHWPELQFEVRGNELWYQGKKTGNIGSDYVYIENPLRPDQNKEQFYFSLKNEDLLQYQQYLMDESGGYIFLSITADLTRI